MNKPHENVATPFTKRQKVAMGALLGATTLGLSAPDANAFSEKSINNRGNELSLQVLNKLAPIIAHNDRATSHVQIRRVNVDWISFDGRNFEMTFRAYQGDRRHRKLVSTDIVEVKVTAPVKHPVRFEDLSGTGNWIWVDLKGRRHARGYNLNPLSQ